ncbi:CBS domain-containing protein [Skermania piniformis]|uniref:CBS domain-containing protein n=1 Tax=Skermania pinensis TaxID=39122 RepID=A0ABX8SAV7_9ACTN|nr:CBS domain-containing protein [Skermania piniformis]QXQ14451.1 CBS domain-containing protein [Skermania piniformis]
MSGEFGDTSVAAAMLREPRLHRPDVTLVDLRDYFDDPHVHVALIVDDRGRLLTAIERADLTDLPASSGPAADLGRLAGRTVAPEADVVATRARMLVEQRRRLAVVDGSGALLGLLALKRTGRGFCSDADVAARHPGA